MARKKRIGEIRVCSQKTTFHGFTMKPGMLFGQDEEGRFVTNGEVTSKMIQVLNTETGETSVKSIPVIKVWRLYESGNWTCSDESVLDSKLAKRVCTMISSLDNMKEAATAKLDNKAWADENAREIGLREGNYNFNTKSPGRPPYVTRKYHGRSEIQTEKNRLDVDPTCGIRYSCIYENPMHPASYGHKFA